MLRNRVGFASQTSIYCNEVKEMNTGIQEYRELLPIVRKLVRVKWRLRVTISCGENTKTHAHCVRSDTQFKRICINKPDMNLSHEGKAATLVHECLHFKGFLSHTKKF